MTTKKPFNGRVIFDHLPKTAGTAVNNWLTSSLGTGCVTANQIGEHQELIRRYGGQYSIISAHLAFNGEGLDPRYQYFACVREPLDRVVSWLFFTVNNHDERGLGSLWREADRFVATEGEELGDELAQNIRNLYVTHFNSISHREATSEAEIVANAVSAIEQYDVWGLFEELTSFLADVAALIRLSPPKHLSRVNVTRVRPKVAGVSAKLRLRLEELNALDSAFYDALRDRFATRTARSEIVTMPGASPWLPYHLNRGNRVFSIPEFTLITAKLEGRGAVSRNEPLLFGLEFSVAVEVPEMEIGINIFDEEGRLAFGTNSTLLRQPLSQIRPGTYNLQYCLLADLPEGSYTVGLAFAERNSEGRRELARYDKLAEFSVTVPRPQASTGYSSLPAVVNYRQVSESIVGLIKDATGSLRVDAAPEFVAVAEEFLLPVRIENGSQETWVSSLRHPITLSYHWLDQAGKIAIFEGKRTPLPSVRLAPGQTVFVELRVVAPTLSGRYRLVLLPVQENHCWLDKCGFVPAVLDGISVEDMGGQETKAFKTQ